MKKVLFLLLVTSMSYGQALFDKGIKITGGQTTTTATNKIISQEANGVLNQINATSLPVSTATAIELYKKQFLSTGLIKNGLITINADNTKFDISAGVGVISNFDIPTSPTSNIITFGAFTGITPAYLTTGNITYLAINSSGAIVQQATDFTTSQRRDLILLGAVIHSNLTNINVVNNISAPTNADTNQLHDFMNYVGALNLDGNKYTANGANLSLNKSAGTIFKFGVNFANDWKRPHELAQAGETLLTFRYRTQNGTESVDRTTLTANVYDLNNVLTTVPNNRFSIQTVTIFQTGLTRIQYGQNLYTSLADAETAILTRDYVVENNIKMNGITRAYIIVKGDATSLQDPAKAHIIEAQKFGGVASGGVALTLANIVTALGYTPENVANKSDSYTVSSSTTYASTKAVVDGLSNLNSKIGSKISKGLISGDSTIASYLGQNSVASYLVENKDLVLGNSITDISVPGNTIDQQKTAWLALTDKNTYDYIIVQIGLNDIDTIESNEVDIAKLQDYINTINLSRKAGSKLIIGTMTPAKQRFIVVLGDTQGLVAYNKWLAINEAIMGFGTTPIVGVEGRVNGHTSILNDGIGNIAPIYDTGDFIHENNTGRNVIASNYRKILNNFDFLTVSTGYDLSGTNYYFKGIKSDGQVTMPNSLGGIGFNSFYYSGQSKFLNNGYANLINTTSSTGAIKMFSSNLNSLGYGGNITYTDIFSLTKEGSLTIPSTITHAPATLANEGVTKAQLDLKQNLLTNPITGTGTTNTIPLFTGTTTQGNSILTQTGTSSINTTGRIGINTTSPSFAIDVLGTGAGGAFGIRLKNTSSGVSQDASFTSENDSGHKGLFFKAGSGYGVFKTIKSGDLGFYNNQFSGDISFLNDNPLGKILLTAGGSSTAHVTVHQTGNTSFGTVTDNGQGVGQFNGNVTFSNGTLSNHGVTKAQLDLKADIVATVNTTGNQTKTGVLSFNNTGALVNGISVTTNTAGSINDSGALFNNIGTGGTALTVSVSNGGFGQLIGASKGKGLFIDVTGNLGNVVGLTLQKNGISTGNLLEFTDGKIEHNGFFTVPKVIMGGTIELKSYTVATLPTGVQGATAYVTDALAPTYLGTLTGGGTVKAPVFYDGTVWRSTIDSDSVSLTGNQTIGGIKTFTGPLIVSNLGGGPSRIVSADVDGKLSASSVFTHDGQISVTNSVTANSFIKSSGTAAQFLKADGSVDESDVVKNIVKDATQGANITGTVSETILYSKLIPANTFKDGDFMTLFSRVAKVGPNATLTQRVRINTSNTLTGATLISTNLLGFANKFGNNTRTFTLYNGNILGFSFATASNTDVLNSNLAVESTTFNPAVDNYIFITGQLSVSSDTMYHLGTKITN